MSVYLGFIPDNKILEQKKQQGKHKNKNVNVSNLEVENESNSSSLDSFSQTDKNSTNNVSTLKTLKQSISQPTSADDDSEGKSDQLFTFKFDFINE